MRSVEDKRREILELIQRLESFPKTKTVRQLQRELAEKLAEIDRKIRERAKRERNRIIHDEEQIQRRQQANLMRSKKMKQKHHYIRLIHDNYPNYKYSDIWKWYSERKRGRKVPVPDVVWQNPSP